MFLPLLLFMDKFSVTRLAGASGTSNAMFDELAERSLMSPLAGTKHTYVRLAIIIYCQILALFFFQVCEWHITQLGILM